MNLFRIWCATPNSIRVMMMQIKMAVSIIGITNINAKYAPSDMK